jgi:hypothetical protein
MFSIVKEWKPFRIHLGELHAWLKEYAGENYKGLTADYTLTLWFEDQVGYELEGAIDDCWEAVTEETESAKFRLDADREAAVAAARAALLTASFDELIPAERKLCLNLALTNADKDTLLVKYPVN